MSRRTPWILLLTLILSGCVIAEGEKGPPGRDGRCSVDAGEGAVVITCDDGSTTTLDGGCTVESGDDGTHTITCPSGETVVRDGERLPRGSITGAVVRYGKPPAAGGSVTVVDLDRSTLDEGGGFAFDDIPMGIYRLRAEYPGYQPTEIPNVTVVGNQVDVGTLMLHLGRKIADRFPDLTLSPDGGHLVLGAEIESSPQRISVIDLATFEETAVHPRIHEHEFAGDRFMVLTTGEEGASQRARFIYDFDEKTTQAIGHVDGVLPLDGGLLLQMDTTWHLLRLPGDEPVALEGAPAADHPKNVVTVVLRREGSVGLLDVETGTIEWHQAGASSVWNLHEPTGRVAFVADEDGDDQLGWYDPVLGTTLLEQVVTSGAEIEWAESGDVFVFANDSGARIHDVEAGTSSELDYQAGDMLRISPSGDLIAYDNGSSHLLLRHKTGETWGIRGLHFAFGPSERTAASTGWTDLDIIDLEAGTTHTHTLGQDYRIEYVSDDLLLLERTSGSRDLVYVLSTDTTYSGRRSESGMILPHHNSLVFKDEDTGMLTLQSLVDGTQRELGLFGLPFFLSSDGSWLFVGTSHGLPSDFNLVSMDDLSVVPIAANAAPVGFSSTGFLYVQGELNPVDLYRDLTTYWGAYP